MNKFKKKWTENWDIKDSILNSITVIKVDEGYAEEKDNVIDFIYYAMDWHNLFFFYSRNKQSNIDLRMYKCEVKGFQRYTPISINKHEGVMKLKKEETNFVEFVVTHSLNNRVDKHIEFMLSQRLIDYVNFEWKMEIDLDNL